MPRPKKETRGRKVIHNTERRKKLAHQEQVNKFNKNCTTSFAFRFHNMNDQEVINKLNSVPNKVDYVRQLILQDIKKQGE